MYEILFALTLIFVIAAVLLLVAARFGLPVIPFYLLAGVLAGLVIDEAQLLDLAQWGIAFLVFLFGVHVDLEAVRSTGSISVAVALLQASIVGGLGFAVGVVLGLDPLNAGYLGVTAALSSSMVATSYLDPEARVRPTFERLAESIHFTEDLLGVGIVLALSALIYADAPAPDQFAVAAGILALALGIRHLVFDRLTARIRGDEEVMMLVGISFVIGFIALAELADLSIVVGAFAAGIAVADDYPHSLELVDTVDDLEDFFTPIFFVTLGALLTIPGGETIGYTAVLVAAILIVNPLVVAFVLLRGGFDGRTAVLTGLTLDQVSAFSLFIAIEALVVETIDRAVFDAIVLSAAVTMIVATYTARHREAINRWLRDRGIVRALASTPADRSRVADDLTDHVVVVDFERGSHPILETCSKLDRPVLVVEDNPVLFAELQERFDNYVYGDVLDEELWNRVRVEEAALVVSLTPEPDRAVAVAGLDVDVPRIVRVDDPDVIPDVLKRDDTTVLYPYAISGERVARDLEAVLAGHLSDEEFVERGRARFESTGSADRQSSQ